MRQAVRASLTAAAVVLAYCVAVAIIERALGMSWLQGRWFSLGNWIIYLGAGFVAACRFSRIPAGLAAALAAGVADGVLGWRINWVIARAPRFFRDHPGAEFTFLFECVLVATVLGIAGALAGRACRWFYDRVGVRAGLRLAVRR